MEQRNIVLRGIATVLNTFGSSLVAVYDLAASTLGSALPGEKEKLKGEIREYEKKMERLYSEVGREVSKEGDMTRLSAVGEAALNLIEGHRLEIEKIKSGLQAIEEAERKEKERVLQEKESAGRLKRAEPEETVKAAGESAPGGKIEKEALTVEAEPPIKTPSLEEPLELKTPAAAAELSGSGMEPEQEMGTEEDEPPREAPPEDTPAPKVLLTGEDSSGVESEKEALAESSESHHRKPTIYTMGILGNKLKGDLLALCIEKGIEADKSMTKAEIIELLLKHR